MTAALLSALLLAAAAAAPAPEPVPGCVNTPQLDVSGCDAAIAAEREPRRKAYLYYVRAYGRVEKGEYETAAEDLAEAVRLDPALAEAWRERAYVFGELRDFGRALAASDREIALRPDAAGGYAERAYLRQRAGDQEGAYRDSSEALARTPGDIQALRSRAGAALWTGRFDVASKDLAEALRLARAATNPEALKAVEKDIADAAQWSDRSPGDATALCKGALETGDAGGPKLIGDCTAAFFAARTPSDKAEMLTIRSLAWLVGRQDQPQAIKDQEVAVGLDPGNGELHTNLGGSYLQVRHSWAGLRELDRAVQISETWPALAQRAAAKRNLKDSSGAFADAKRSFEIEPNEVALLVLGDISKERGDVASAKLYWMGAWHLGSRDDGTVERLKSVGVDHPDREPEPK